jgi:hypothetical protein
MLAGDLSRISNSAEVRVRASREGKGHCPAIAEALSKRGEAAKSRIQEDIVKYFRYFAAVAMVASFLSAAGAQASALQNGAAALYLFKEGVDQAARAWENHIDRNTEAAEERLRQQRDNFARTHDYGH